MIQFDMKRFLSVGRWDVTLNRKFYLNQAAGLLVLAAFPVLLRFLLWWAMGDVSLLGIGHDGLDSGVSLASHASALAKFYSLVTGVMPIIGLGYMFHNMVHKQGRISELTLPASNVERFLWHALFCVVAPLAVFACSIVIADVLNLFLAVLFGCVSGVRSITLAWLTEEWEDPGVLGDLWAHPTLAYAALWLAVLCFISTFALGNAWKYRYNIIYTLLAHWLLWMVLGFVVMFACGVLVQVVSVEWLHSLDWNFNPDGTVVLVVLCLLLLALLAGIWRLTYKLYCDAQVTSRRNR